jgi:hypothetical protein
MKVKQYSPMLTSFEVLAKGNLKQKTRLTHIFRKLEDHDPLLFPIIKSKYKEMNDDKGRKHKPGILFDGKANN